MESGICSPWDEVVHLGREFTLEKDRTILGHGECIDGIYYLKRGILRLFSFDADGNEAILLYVTDGNLIGDSAFFNNMPVYATFSAVEESVVYYFPRNTVESVILPQYPLIMRNMLEYMAYKVGVLLHHQCEVVSDNVIGKVSRMLYDIAKYEGFPVRFRARITQKEMATALGLHRATFSKAIAELKRLGVLEWTKHQIIEMRDYSTISMYANNVFAL
jgi:CRP/FNR family transcriptional regulator